MKCEECGKEAFMPFICQSCGRRFCSEHRLPENHHCAQSGKIRTSRRAVASEVSRRSSREYPSIYQPSRIERKTFGSNRKEIAHLTIASLLVVGVGLSLPNAASRDYLTLTLLSIMFAASFMTHEIAHKAAAQKSGLLAEFRLNLIGTVLTLLSIVSPFIKIIGPGAVIVSGTADKNTIGRISVVGPVANLILASATYVASFLPVLGWFFVIASFYNAWIAFFNLIPIGMLDGYKVFSWSKKIWASVFVASAILIAATYVSIS